MKTALVRFCTALLALLTSLVALATALVKFIVTGIGLATMGLESLRTRRPVRPVATAAPSAPSVPASARPNLRVVPAVPSKRDQLVVGLMGFGYKRPNVERFVGGLDRELETESMPELIKRGIAALARVA